MLLGQISSQLLNWPGAIFSSAFVILAFSYLLCSFTLSSLDFSGNFNIQPDKKSPPEPRVAKRLGMIAGGTGACRWSHPPAIADVAMKTLK